MISLTLTSLSSTLAILAAMAPATPAAAQTAQALPNRNFEADLFQPAIGPRNFLTLDAPEVPTHKQLSVGAFYDYQVDPYRISYTTLRANSIADEHVSHVVANQHKLELQGSIGLLDRFQVGVALPVTLVLNGEEVAAMGNNAAGSRFSATGLGDLRIEAKGVLTTFGEDDQLVLAGLLGGTAPTGKADAYLRNAGPTGRAKLLASLQLGRVRLGGQVGAVLRETVTTLDAKVGSQLLYGGAASVRVLKELEVIGEVVGRSGLNEFTQLWWDQNPVEADVAARFYPIGMVGITGGFGTGFGKGIGAPRGRVFLGVVFTPDFRDADQDGVYDSEDRCPDQREDRDGFQDKDGCPEPDNDSDGLPDPNDRCPNDAEDLDQFEDTDGCPELDNDKDGMPDLNDPCPNAAEDGRGKRPKDGCPSTSEDQDGDTVNDTIDKCPDEPEDRDLFQDDDGCPDPDNDGDGIPDGFDNCPSEAEDADNFEDEDGCPEPDNDKDGFSDATDKCPEKPETLNGKDDGDGCPDNGTEFVKLTEQTIEFSERVQYVGRGGRSEIRESSANSLGLIALVLKGHPEIAQLRIEVQTDGVSRDETQRRAELIRDAIVRRGVDASRLTPVGLGGGGSRLSFIIVEKKLPKPASPAGAPAEKPADAP